MPHSWRTHPDPFADVWTGVVERLTLNPGLEARTLFRQLQREHPGRFPDGQLRTFQRRVKTWRASHGPAKEVFFAQMHAPGRLCASDFTHMTDLRVTINGRPFEHLIYHFVLTYSNWETGTVCFAESFETLADGLQNALAELGGVPAVHRTDRLTAAIPPGTTGAEFTQRYRALLAHYGLDGQAIQAGRGNENGDVEQRHHRFKRALDQQLMLRASRDFTSREAYQGYLRDLFAQLNANRDAKKALEVEHLRDPRQGEHVLGVEPTDRRAGRGAPARRARGGVVRAEGGGTGAAVARSRSAPDQLPARDRLAGPQAGCVRGVPVPGRPVPDDHVPDRVRRAAVARAGASGPRVPAPAPVRGERQ
jgi:hypothetical protein